MPDSQSVQQTRLNATAATALAIPVLFLVADIIAHPLIVSGEVGLRLAEVEWQYHGFNAYSDYFGLTQPALINLMLAARLISDFVALKVSAAAGYQLFCALGLIISIALAYQTKKLILTGYFYPLCLALLFSALVGRFDLGSTQQLFILALLPWILLRWSAYENIAKQTNENGWAEKTQLITKIVTGSLLGLTLCCEPALCIVVLSLELTLALNTGKWKNFVGFESLAIIATVGLYVIWLARLPEAQHRGYWDWALTLRHLNTLCFDPALINPGSSPDQIIWFYALALVMLAAFFLHIKSRLYPAFATITITGMIVFINNRTGLSADLLVMQFGLFGLLALIFTDFSAGIKESGLKFISISILGTALTASLFNQIRNSDLTDSPNLPDSLRETILKHTQGGANVVVWANYAQNTIPLLRMNGPRSLQYLPIMRPLALTTIPQCQDLSLDQQKKIATFQKFACEKIRLELQSNSLQAILIETPSVEDLLTRLGLKEILQANFTPMQTCSNNADNSPGRECLEGLTTFRLWVRKK